MHSYELYLKLYLDLIIGEGVFISCFESDLDVDDFVFILSEEYVVCVKEGSLCI